MARVVSMAGKKSNQVISLMKKSQSNACCRRLHTRFLQRIFPPHPAKTSPLINKEIP
jgi:hypothetical protein